VRILLVASKEYILHFLRPRFNAPPWNDKAPVRQELFGIERLEQHAQTLAAAQQITLSPKKVISLHVRLDDNDRSLLAAYRGNVIEIEQGRNVVPAAEWLLDNYHLVEDQVREIRDDLPAGFYRQLPKLANGPFIGYPRVFGLAWAFIAHTDSHFDPDMLRRFLQSYQQVQALTIGELWAVAITLRIVLIENLRRLADQINVARIDRQDANNLADSLLKTGCARSALEADISARPTGPLCEPFAAQLAKRLRDQDPRTMPALEWLEQRLQLQGQSVAEVVQHSHLRQGASNVSIRNIILSMRLISDIDWAELFESVSLVDARLSTGSHFTAMDFPTRNLYRSAIEQLAQGSALSELEIADQVLLAAASGNQILNGKVQDTETTDELLIEPHSVEDASDFERHSDPGFYLIDAGRLAFEQQIGFKPKLHLTLNRIQIRLGMPGYVGTILLLTCALLLFALEVLELAGFTQFSSFSNLLQGNQFLAVMLVLLLGFLPATDVASALVNRMVTWRFGAVSLPGLDLVDGVPASMRTLIAVPILLTNKAEILEQVERLEVHFLAGVEGDLSFALLSDGLDADSEILAGDAELLAIATAAIASLNERYGPSPAGVRFLLLHRRRQFNPSEQKWMGWERKRGKLHELNRLLRGATDTSYISLADLAAVPTNVRYVIVLDADTRLPRDTAMKLIGKLAHPLNRAQFSQQGQRVVRGYGILQPRVTPSLSTGKEGSLYQRIFSSPGGLDPYAGAVSDVYQDLFGEGSFTGKGIYDVDAFTKALHGRVAENTMLSHDLFEGVFARAGLVSDVEVIEEFPARYDVASVRQHRWTRGDWQLLPWIFGKYSGNHAVSSVGRWKMLDNLRRSMVPPATLLAFFVCWLWPLREAFTATLLLFACIAIPAFLPSLFTIFPHRSGINIQHHLRMLVAGLRLAFTQTGLNLALLPDQAWRMLDAMLRSLWRMSVSRKHLLEWKTAAQSNNCPRLSLGGFYRCMIFGTTLTTALILLILYINPVAWPLLLGFGLLWLAAPGIALWASRPPAIPEGPQFDEQNSHLRLIARKTWRFFETFVTAADNMLPPDNFQDDPEPLIAHRTSPTNMGLYLLSSIAARDFGWAGTLQTLERLEASLSAMEKLPKFRGHFFNWYQTQDARVLAPEYISAVDSGNLAGHLLALANACEEWLHQPMGENTRAAIIDNMAMAREALQQEQIFTNRGKTIQALFEELELQLLGVQSLDAVAPGLLHLLDKAHREAEGLLPNNPNAQNTDLLFWIDALHRVIVEHERDRVLLHGENQDWQLRVKSLAGRARAMCMAMDFSFLLDPERKLLSIGYSVTDNTLDESCYDLLASEARLASLIAIAKGDINTKHWFRLGRTATPMGNGSALISWSGSMFEYLMPSLVMRGPVGSLLEQTNRLVVGRQRAYALQCGIPWGISESAYNARDIELTYQYSNFGVPGLGLKRGLAEDLVIAPYATALAAMIDPQAAEQNFNRLAQLGAYGRFGFYEAVDFTRSRLPKGTQSVVVKNFMAHHQGMSIVAILNTLQQGLMRRRFHREPMIQACELLLQERVPRDVAIAHPRAEEVQASSHATYTEEAKVRRPNPAARGAPHTHMLSNGRYSVMLTAAGAGYSRWKDIAITRWREDATRDHWGSYIFLRDVISGEKWSAGAQPLGLSHAHKVGVFAEDSAEFIHHQDQLITTMDVLVSGEDDGEVRRISLSNSGRQSRDIELTSYAELVLTSAAADSAHPAFSKMFVQTEYIPELGALIATRRPRSASETRIWTAHFAIVEGELSANPQYESDRLAFIGRGNSVATAAAMQGNQALSNTVGTVLDPIFSVRRRLRIDSGKVARVAFWTLVASSREALLALIDRHHDRSAYDRAKTLAWTQAQVQLRHLGVKFTEAAEFQRLASALIYANPRFRSSSTTISRGARVQSELWSLSISGDLPIALLRIDDIEDIAQVRQLLRAHEYWRSKGLAVDLVIINEHPSSYLQDLQTVIETAIRTSQSRPRLNNELAVGAVFALRADLLAAAHCELLKSIARVVLTARNGPLHKQFIRLPALSVRALPIPPVKIRPVLKEAEPDWSQSLEFFNGTGGFAKQGKEYVTLLQQGSATPAPWINVIANPHFGFNVAAEGSGYTWSESSRENQLTPWSNDPVTAPIAEVFYVQDLDLGEIYTATALPIRDSGLYISRHGFGYSQFEHKVTGLSMSLVQYVPLVDPIKISRLTLTNTSKHSRHLCVTSFTEWVLGRERGASAPFVITERDDSGAILATNPWGIGFAGRVAFADLNGQQQASTADRTEMLGRNGDVSAPASLVRMKELGESFGAGMDPCAALQYTFKLAPGEQIEVVGFLGQCSDKEAAQALIQRYRAIDLDSVFAEVEQHWADLLGGVQVKTPDRSMDIMLNGWLLYQTLACRIWARSAFYQASGAYGFRDQLQDGMALTFAHSELTRSHILRAASRQFVEGDVQHWWLPHSGQGVRTRISDDRAWLAFATALYVQRTHDHGILAEQIAFLEGPALEKGAHDAYFHPAITDETASLFVHCARALDQSLALIGENGLPLMGTGDWNDGMNQVGEQGKGESVWLAWLLIRAITLFAPLAQSQNLFEQKRAQRWVIQADAIKQAVENCAWDGQWYRRATFDDGSWLGSSTSIECQIDSIAQSWAVLSEAADPERAAVAMASLDKLLVRPEQGLALLFTPPFDQSDPSPGYIQGYPPGLRENGGQYSHAAMWAILAFANMGEGDKAWDLFNMVNPINHSRDHHEMMRYKVEPYVVAADVYSVAPHTGRGGWTWYTGAAGWLYQAGIEGILGVRRQGAFISLAPTLPTHWPGFEATIQIEASSYRITVKQTVSEHKKVLSSATLDDAPAAIFDGALQLALDGRQHNVNVILL
jgi:cyclic beta-1,2-glucan synthetase